MKNFVRMKGSKHQLVCSTKGLLKINLFGKAVVISYLLLTSFSCFSTQPVRQAMRADRVYAPISQSGKEEIILEHKAYRLSYNPQWRIANWVAYELTREELITKVKRKNNFRPDPLLARNSAVDTDYRRSGYDRGHLAPSADMRYDLEAQMECFYFSNICPQSSKLNSVRWKQLEMKVREWAARDNALIVVTGPVVKAGYQTIGSNRIAVPAQFYKIILSLYAGKPKCIAFLMNNGNERKKLSSYAVPVDSIEKITGIDFFPVLPDNQEEALESKVILSHWVF
jgi:endonuclease G, mitochondrial